MKASLFKIWKECSDDCFLLTTILVILWLVLQIWGKSQKLWTQNVPLSPRAVMENICNAKLSCLKYYYWALSKVVWLWQSCLHDLSLFYFLFAVYKICARLWYLGFKDVQKVRRKLYRVIISLANYNILLCFLIVIQGCSHIEKIRL